MDGECRSCGRVGLRSILDLGEVPLANDLVSAEALELEQPRFPLELAMCEDCGLVQILHAVPPERLFREYVYFSSVSDALLAHSRAHVTALIEERKLGPDRLVVEVASNDGYLLQYFVEAGIPVLGIEPARNVAQVAIDRGIPTRTEFFGRALAEQLTHEGVRADVLLGNNVLAHVPDLNGFVAGIATLLAPGGVAELEFPYVVDLVDNLLFDTIYHEHLSYFSVHALVPLFARHGLDLVRVQHLPVHGGSLRITATPAADQAPRDASVDAFLAEEHRRGFDRHGAYADFAARVRTLGNTLVGELTRLRAEGSRIAAYGASAKGATLLNTFGIGADLLDYVVDRSPAKQGRFTPGTKLPIRPADVLADERPDYALLLTWNFADEILAQQHAYRAAGGKFIVPVPEVRVV